MFFEKGFAGYDPQTGKLFTEPTAFSTEFGQTNEKVSEYFAPGVKEEKPSEAWRLIKLGGRFLSHCPIDSVFFLTNWQALLRCRTTQHLNTTF